MTATHPGQPAHDPDDGAPGGDASRDQDATVGVPAASWRPAAAGAAPEPASGRIAALRGRLVTPMPGDRPWGWVGPLLVTAFALFLRLYRLSVPNAVIFDETYYAKDAWSILKHGVEWNMLPNPANNANYLNNLIISSNGHANIFASCTGTSCGEYVVQPPVGKLLIAVGEWFSGLTTLGWRLAPAIAGTLAVLIMCRVARRLTRSTILGCTAGLLLSLDGLEFVLSRTGILDIFLMLFVLASFGALVVDRDVSAARFAERMVLAPGDDGGPRLGPRRWRVIAGVLLGLACASKQYAVWYIPAFIGLCLFWDIGFRRSLGARRPVSGALRRDGSWLPLTLGAIPLVTYTLTWLGWLLTNTGYDRDYAQQNGTNIPVISPLISLFQYHHEMVKFGVGLSTPHPYESQPWDWFVISRPVAFFWRSYSDAGGLHPWTNQKTTGPYVQEVLAIGNPAIWWVTIPVLAFLLGWWLTRRDWRAGAVLLCVFAGWASWLPFASRTKFDYYSLEFLPFLVIGIVLVLGLIIGPASASVARRATGSALAGVYVLAVVVLFWYFYPILAGKIILYSDWLSHMWYRGWI